MSLRKRLAKGIDFAIAVGALMVILAPSSPARRLLDNMKQNRADRRAIEAHWDPLVLTGSRVGGENPEEIIVEFMDYECPACRASKPTLDSLRGAVGDFALVVHHLPLGGLHPSAQGAAAASVCADRAGAFQAYHNALLSREDWIEAENWASLALSVGVSDTTGFIDCLESPETTARLEADRRLAEALNIQSIPVFISQRTMVRGLRAFEGMKKLFR